MDNDQDRSVKDRSISWNACVKLIVSAVIIFLIMRYWGMAEDFLGVLFAGTFAIVAGLIIAYVLNIPLRFFERVLPGPTGDGTRNRGLALLLTIACVIIIALFVGGVVIPGLVEAVVALAERTPAFVQSLTENKAIASLIPRDILKSLKSIDWDAVVNDVASMLQSGAVSSLPQISSLLEQVGNWLMGLVFAFWFVGDKDKLSGNVHAVIRHYAGKDADDRFRRVIGYADESFHNYVVAQSLVGVAFGGLVAVICLVADIPDAPMYGALVGVMSLIPEIGAIAGAVLGAIMILATSWQKALIFLVIFFVAQQVEENVFYPQIMVKRVGLTGMWPLVGTTVGMAAFGFAGAFVGVPLLATLFRIMKDDMKRRDQLPEDTPSPLEKLKGSLRD